MGPNTLQPTETGQNTLDLSPIDWRTSDNVETTVKYRVGSVPYLNAKPLVRQFEDLGASSPVSVVYDVPSQLPALLEAGEVQAILVSSIEALRHPDLHFADGVSICSQREVFSVRLFSKVPFGEIRRLALDASSMTSNALAQILLDQRFGVRPATTTLPPDLDLMLAECDAGILIGDNGMRATGPEGPDARGEDYLRRPCLAISV